MAKAGKAKNTKNKAKHSKLMSQKFDKKRKEKDTRAEKLKAIIQKAKAEKKEQVHKNQRKTKKQRFVSLFSHPSGIFKMAWKLFRISCLKMV